MIPIPNDYDKARAFDGSVAPNLTPGGHICKIRGVRMEKTRNGKDMLVVAYDICEGGEFDDFFKEKYARAAKYNLAATWPGVYRVTLLNSEGSTNGFFKGFIEALEASNSGYNFKASNGDERMMNGKLVGFNFGEEEYEYTDRQTGEIKVGTSCKPQYAVSVERVREGLIPPAKKHLENRASSSSSFPSSSFPASNNPPVNQGFTEVDDDELPF